MTSYQAVLPNSTQAPPNATASFAVSLFGENSAAGETAEAVLGDVVVSVIGAGWSAVVEQAAASSLG